MHEHPVLELPLTHDVLPRLQSSLNRWYELPRSNQLFSDDMNNLAQLSRHDRSSSRHAPQKQQLSSRIPAVSRTSNLKHTHMIMESRANYCVTKIIPPNVSCLWARVCVTESLEAVYK